MRPIKRPDYNLKLKLKLSRFLNNVTTAVGPVLYAMYTKLEDINNQHRVEALADYT